MKAYFVRHGKTQYNKDGMFSGQTDIPLIEEGIKQAEDLCKELDTDFHFIYSSDLIRCKQTAEILNQKMNLDIRFDPRLRERNFGSFEGKKYSEMNDLFREKDKTQEYNYKPFGGEAVNEVKKRVFGFLEDLKNKHSDSDKILIVTHGGIIRMLHFILNNDPREIIHNSSFHEFEF